MIAGNKIKKPLKKRFKEEDDIEIPKNKKKHHDKSTYRMLRQQQKEDYVI